MYKKKVLNLQDGVLQTSHSTLASLYLADLTARAPPAIKAYPQSNCYFSPSKIFK